VAKLHTATEKRGQFRAALSAGPIVIAPGCADPISARLVERVGIAAVHASGSVLHRVNGYADVGLLTLTEMVARTAAIVDSVNIPVIADGEEGFGSSLHVARTVREFERAGAAAIHIEDSTIPKRPLHMGFGESTISRAEMVDKIRTAVKARNDPSFVIIARSQLPSDFKEMKERLYECLEAGADAFWLIAREPDQVRELCAYLAGKPGIGVLPNSMTTSEFESCGARCALIPQALSIVALHAQHQVLMEILSSGTPNTYLSAQSGIKEMTDFYVRQGAEDL
jgi:2-methylisocitrate lyase-like PEP mutase family enzyme